MNPRTQAQVIGLLEATLAAVLAAYVTVACIVGSN
jgi:hypothetical protein